MFFLQTSGTSLKSLILIVYLGVVVLLCEALKEEMVFLENTLPCMCEVVLQEPE